MHLEQSVQYAIEVRVEPAVAITRHITRAWPNPLHRLAPCIRAMSVVSLECTETGVDTDDKSRGVGPSVSWGARALVGALRRRDALGTDDQGIHYKNSRTPSFGSRVGPTTPDNQLRQHQQSTELSCFPPTIFIRGRQVKTVTPVARPTQVGQA